MAIFGQFQFRRDTAANWTSNNPTLLAGEMGFETNTSKIKIGDGSTAWNSLAYMSSLVTAAQVEQQAFSYAADSGTANAYAVTLSPAPTIVAGSLVVMKVAHTNTGASTIAVNGAGTKAITKNGTTALVGGELNAGQIVPLVYDGTQYQIVGGSGGGGGTAYANSTYGVYWSTLGDNNTNTPNFGTNNQIFVGIVTIPFEIIFSNIYVVVHATDTVGFYDFGIYDLTISPGTLLANIGASHLPNSGVQKFATTQGSVTLNPGIYCFAATGNIQTATVGVMSNTAGAFIRPFNSGAAGTSSSGGALPSSITLPSTSAPTTNGNTIIFGLS